MQAEPLIEWPQPIWEYVKFASEFGAVGAAGFCYAAVRGRDRGEGAEASFHARALVRAAGIGLVAQIVQAFLFWHDLPGQMHRAHATSSVAFLTGNLAAGLQALLVAAALLGFALAVGRIRAGWVLAVIGVVFGQLTGIVTGQWSRLVNPVHRLVGALWLGTLFVLIVAGLTPLLRDESVRDRRGSLAAEMVNGFSPLALTCGVIVVLSGLTTAWTHLNPLSSLWSTPYGYALIVKLMIVAVVFALGAWNWRRARPSLGSEEAAVTLRRSASREVIAAALVLAASAILVSLPSPRPPGARGPGGGGAAGGPPPPAAPQ